VNYPILPQRLKYQEYYNLYAVMKACFLKEIQISLFRRFGERKYCYWRDRLNTINMLNKIF